MKKRKLALLLTLAMILSMFPINAFATEFSDMPDDWSTKALENAVANGLLKGDNGKIMPNENLTRAQMATIVNRAFGATEKSSIDGFTDVKKDAWYYDEMSKAVQMKTFIGSGDKLYPDNSITREEAFIVLARAFKLSGVNENALDKFSDKDNISDWAVDGVASLVATGYIAGSNGRINPKQNITRAEFAQVMDNLLKNYINKEGTYTEDYSGNLMINVPNVTLKGLTVTGDLIIGDGVGDGEVTLDDVTVTGRVLVRGGGENSIKIIGNSNINNIIIARVDGKVRIYAEDGTEVGEVIADGYDDVIIEGNFESVTIVGTDITVTATNATVESASIEGENSKIIIDEKSSVKTINVNANNAEISGKGTVESVTANANNVEVTVPGASVTAGQGTTGVTAGDKPVEPGKTETVKEEKTPVSPGGSGSSRVAVSAISVEGVAKVGETLTAKVTPSGATVNYQWMRADAENGEYEDIDDATNNTYELVANDAGKYIKVKATGRGNYRGTVESEPVGPVEEEPQEPAIIADPGVSPADGTTVEGVQEFTFGFKSATGSLEELELDIYLGENTGANRDYAEHLGINLPAGSEAVEAWVDQVVANYSNLDEKYHAILAAAGYNAEAGDDDNKQALKENIFYTGDEKAGTWTIKLDTAVLDVEAIEFLVAVRDDQGAQWGNNNYVSYPNDVKAFLYNVTLPEPAIIADPGVSPADGTTVEGVQAFTFGFKSATGSLEELELDIYLGENTGENRDYAGHLGINLPAGSEAVASWVEQVVAGYGELDSKFHGLLAAAGYVVDAGDEANKQALKENIFYTAGDDGTGTWTIKLDTAVLGEEKVEFLVTVRDDAGAQWGNNNYVSYPNDVKAFLYNVTLPEPAIIADPGVSPADGTTVEGVQAFTFGFKSATGSLEELELDIYLGENTGENRDYAGHLGINLPAGSEAVASWVEQVVAGYGELDSKFHGLLAAAGYVVDAGDEANKQALKENIFYTAGDDGTGTWTIKLDTAVLGEEKVEFLVTVRDDAGAQWGNNNYVSYPNDVKAFLYNVTLPEPAIIADPGVSPADGTTVEGVQAFTFGFKSATGSLEELELDIYLGENTGENRDYAGHLGINLPAGSEAVASWVEQVVAGYGELDSKFHGLLAAAGYVVDAGDEANKQALKENIFYTAGDDGTGTWTIKLDTAVLGEEKVEFLVTVRDDAGAQWGNNNYVSYPNDVKAFLYNVTLPEPAIIADPGVSPADGTTVEGVQAFTFGFKSATGSLEELELDIYLGENTGENRDYAGHLGINLPAGSEAVASWVEQVVAGYGELDSKFHGLLAAAGYVVDAGDEANKQALKENIFYTAGDDGTGTWTIKLDTAVLGEEKVEFLVTVRDDAGAQWGNNNYVSYPNDVKAFLYNVTLPEPAIIADPGVSPADGTTVEGVQAFTFGFKSATGSLEELELDIYLGENTGENRDYAGHLGINLPAGSEAVASWVEQVVAGYGELDSKFHGLLAAAGYVVDAGDEANKQALKENIFYTAGDDGTGTWTIKLDTAVLGEEKVEFLVTVRDDAGAQWGNNNYVSYPNDVKAFLYNVTLPEPAIIADPGVSPADGTTVEGVQAFTFGFKSATGSLEELELDIYLGENTGENRDYAGHLGINLPAGSEAVASWVEQVVAGYGELDSKFHGLLAAAGYVVDAGDEANKQALKENIFYTAGDDGTGTWTIKLDTAVLGEEKVEFLVTVRDDAGAQWGNNNYVSYPNDVKAFLYNVTLPEPAIIADPGVSPADGTTVEGVQAFTFGFKSATGSLEELELDIYLGENTGENRDYAGHLGINLPAGSEAVASWVEQVVAGYGELDSKFHGLLAAAGYVVDAGDEANKQALKENIFYTAGDDGTGTWTIKLDTAVLGEEKVEFLVTVRDDAGAQWGNNNYVSYPNDVKAFLYNVTLPEEPAERKQPS